MIRPRGHRPVSCNDTLFCFFARKGEWVAAGKSAVVLLPPQNIKVPLHSSLKRRLVRSIMAIRRGLQLTASQTRFIGKVSYISPHAEYTPPISSTAARPPDLINEDRFDHEDEFRAAFPAVDDWRGVFRMR